MIESRDTSNLDQLAFTLKYDEVARAPERIKEWIRHECQTNLRFLVNCVLRPDTSKTPPLLERVHGPIMDTFLRPVPGQRFDLWSPVKERVTLAFRGAMKTTIHAGFLTQVVLCEPDIRVLILSGKLAHAQTILQLASSPFANNEVLRLLFPQWGVSIDDLSKDKFISPKRNSALNLRDPTFAVATFDSVKAGGHYELVDFDDCTNEINCATPELVEKNEQHYDDTDPLVEPGGYRHFFGTRWAPDDSDLPEVIKRRGETYAEDNEGERNTVYFALPVWYVKTDGTPEEQKERADRDKRNTLKPSDVTLTWPEKLNARYLWPKYRNNPTRFNRQYLLRYAGGGVTESFTRDLLFQNTRPFHEGMPRPHDRYLVIHWDLAGIYSGRSSRNASDYTCGLAGMFELSTRRLFIYDAVLEVFASSTEMARAIVSFYGRQLRVGNVGVCSIEDRTGARLLQGEIMSIAKAMQIPAQVSYVLQPSIAGIKNANIARLAGAVRQSLVQFSTNLPNRDEIFRQFEKWAPTNKHQKDDAPDCAAQMWVQYSDSIFPGIVQIMQPSEATFFEPEPYSPMDQEVDPHADEREYADFDLLNSMTVRHA